MIASLPMYWRGETAPAWRGFWNDIRDAARDEGVDLPDLMPPEDLPNDWTDHWRDPNLVLSQTCSLPFRTALRGQVSYVGTFDFALVDDIGPCPAGQYFSRYIHPAGQFTARLNGTAAPRPDPMRFAINAFDSQSGWASTWLHDTSIKRLLRPNVEYVVTGSHAASLAAVAEGRADIAALDEVTWRLLQRHDPNAQKVEAGGTTAPSPGLPLITRLGGDTAPLRNALLNASTQSTWLGHADLGGLRGFEQLPEGDYFALPVPPPPDAARIT